jgi:hypothetical protein
MACAPSPAKPKPANVVESEKLDGARLVEEGRELASRGAHAEAIRKFEASMKAVANPALLYDIGRSYELLGKKQEAAETYEKCVFSNDLSHTDKMSMELRIKLLRESP